MMRTPRLLVSSIDVWNNTSGSDTFTNLLSGYNPKKVANIYFRSGVPTSTAATSYFYICENSVIKSIFRQSEQTGWCVEKNVNADGRKEMECNISIEKSRYAFFSKHRLWLFVFARELLWKLGNWKSPELERFVQEFDPEVLFFPVESYIHFNRVNRYLIEKTKVPAIAYIWDDNFTYKGSKNVGFLIHRFFLRRSVKKLVDKVQKVFVINSKMQREFKDCYGIDAEILTKGANIAAYSNSKESSAPLKMVYTGKMLYGRLETIQMISEILDEVNQNGIKISFEIYSGTQLNEYEKQSLTRKGVHFCGSVTQEKVAAIQAEADILLLAEAISGKHVYDARLSFSTKVVDYLAAGKCIVAVGPRDIASIEYLTDENAALTASNREEILDLFKNQLNVAVVREYGVRARNLAIEKHNIKDVQKHLYDSFASVL